MKEIGVKIKDKDHLTGLRDCVAYCLEHCQGDFCGLRNCCQENLNTLNTMLEDPKMTVSIPRRILTALDELEMGSPNDVAKKAGMDKRTVEKHATGMMDLGLIVGNTVWVGKKTRIWAYKIAPAYFPIWTLVKGHQKDF